MSYTVFVAYTDDECKAFGIGEDCYTIDNISDLHEAIGIAEKEMKQEQRLADGFEVRHAFIVNEQNNFTVWHSNDTPELKTYNSYSYDEWNTVQHGHHEKSDKPSVYFDIDGTLGKWYADGWGLSYEEIIDPQNHYFRNIEPHDMMILLAKKLQEDGVDVCIISAADKNTIRDKWEWIDEHLPFIPKENICFSPIGADKSEFVKGNAEISILIDDYNKNLEDWKGTSIKAINTVNSHQDKFAEIDFTYSESLLKEYPAFFVTDVDPWIRNEINNSLSAAAEGVMDAVEKISERLDIENQLLEDGIDKEDAKLAAKIFTDARYRDKDTEQQDASLSTNDDSVDLHIAGSAASISEIKDFALSTGATVSSERTFFIVVNTWESRADDIKELALSRDAKVFEYGVHQVIANYGFDGGIDEKYNYRSLDEAVRVAQKEMNGGAIGAGVYNLATKKIEHTIGDFDVREIFSDDVLKINGIDTAEGKPKNKGTKQQGIEW